MTLTNFEQLKETLKDLENFSPEKLESLISQTIQTFHDLQRKIDSPNEADREEALQIALDFKDSLEKQTSALREKIGMNEEELDTFVENPANFSTEENRAIQLVTQELDQFKNELGTTSVPKKLRKTAAAWVHG